MPPSPRLTVTVNEAKLAECCKSMGITVPPIHILPRIPHGTKTTYGGPGWTFYGLYLPDKQEVSLFTEIDSFEYERLHIVNGSLVKTLLHELRHHWQNLSEGWKDGSVIRNEEDAESFAQDNYHKWRGVITIKRQMFHRKLPG